MSAENCPKLETCYKIKMILDKDLLDFQYAESIREVCAICSEVKERKDASNEVRAVVIGDNYK